VRGYLFHDRATRTLRGRLAAELDLHILLPLCQAYRQKALVKVINDFDFGSSPRAEMDFTRRFEPDRRFRWKGRIWLENCTYRGVHALRMDAQLHGDFSPTNAVMRYEPLLVVRPEGVARGTFKVDFREGIARFDLDSQIHPKSLFRMIGLFSDRTMKAYHFQGPTRLEATGVADWKTLQRTDFTGKLDGRNVGIGKFMADHCSFDMAMVGLTNRVSGLRARLCDGDLEGEATFIAPGRQATNMVYVVHASIRDADFDRIAERIMGAASNEYRGRFSGRVTVKGMVGKGMGKSARGTASLRIKDGRVFLLPVFGGFSQTMTKLIPGLGFVLRQTDARANMVIEDGKLHSDDLKIEGDVLSLRGVGDYHFDRRVDFDAQVTLMKQHTLVGKLTQTLVYPLSRMFQFDLTGTTADPRWSLDIAGLPAALMEKLGLRERRPADTDVGAGGKPADAVGP
jgi:hypothetical protein